MAGPNDHPNAGYPAWMPHPVVPVTVVVGPPGNGAAGYAVMHAAPGEVIIDLAAIITEISGRPASEDNGQWVVAALGRRNEMLAALAKPGDATGAWLISPAPLQWQRDFWSRVLGARIVLLDPGKQVCLANAAREGVASKWIFRWYSEAADAMAGLMAPAARGPVARPPAAPAAARESSTKRGYGSSHKTNRDKQLLAEPWCRFCWEERKVRVPATVLDHVTPFRQSDGSIDWKLWGDPKNWRSACKPCHDARGAQGNRLEKPAGAGGDGRPMDPAHPWNRGK
jgi:5-methylcytosine-specific restriction protein A